MFNRKFGTPAFPERERERESECLSCCLLIIISAGSKLRGNSAVLNTRKFRNVIYSSSMSAEMSAEISASGSFNYKFVESQHCRATMYYNPSCSLYRDSDDEFLLFSHRRREGGDGRQYPMAAGRTLCGFTDAQPSPQANQ